MLRATLMMVPSHLGNYIDAVLDRVRVVRVLVNGSSRSLQHGRAAWLTQTMQTRDERKHDIGAVGQVASEVIVSFSERIGEYAKSHTQSESLRRDQHRSTSLCAHKAICTTTVLLPSTASSISFCDAFFFSPASAYFTCPPPPLLHTGHPDH